MWHCSICNDDHPGVWKGDGSNVCPKLSKGVKFDADKPKWQLIPWDAVKEVVIVFTTGAKKYEDRNWEKGMNYSRIYASTMRHLTSWFQDREELDPDGTGLRQIAQAAWGCLVLTAYELRGMTKFDDRPGEQCDE